MVDRVASATNIVLVTGSVVADSQSHLAAEEVLESFKLLFAVEG